MRDARAALVSGLSSAVVRAGSGEAGRGLGLWTDEVSFNTDISTAAAIQGFLFGFFGALALLIPVFTVIIVIVNEAASGNRTLQLLSGLSTIAYWLTNLAWDLLAFSTSLLIMIIFMTIFPDDFKVTQTIFSMSVGRGNGRWAGESGCVLLHGADVRAGDDPLRLHAVLRDEDGAGGRPRRRPRRPLLQHRRAHLASLLRMLWKSSRS